MNDYIAGLVDPDVLWPYSLMVFGAVCIILFASVVLKTKWWRSGAGVNVFCLSAWFVFVMVLGILGILGLLPEWWRSWSRFLIYSTGSVILSWRVFTVWYWNRGFWAWTDTRVREEVKNVP